MRNEKKTPLIIFLTFVVTSAMYLIAFIFVPGLSSFIGNGNSALFGSHKGKTNSDLTEKIAEIDSYIENEYIYEADRKELNDTAVKGYVAALGDVYSQYFTKEEYDELNAEVSGNYKGVGIEVTIDEDNLITVLAAYKDAPADKAGIRSGDKIIAVSGTEVNGNNYEQAINMIKGVGKYGKSDTVTITILRGEETFDTDVTRERIIVQSVSAQMLEDDIGYVQVSTFGEETDEQFEKEVSSLMSRGARSLILDLRNNGGGLLTTVVYISDYLLPEGKILTIEGKNTEPQVFKSESECIDIPMCVLINGNSASASEVLAGALKDHKKAVLVGETTYGKGLVQTLHELSDGSGLKLTTAQYYTPSGECIDKVGIKPDIEVPMELTKNLSLYEKEEDIQLQEAIKQLKK